MTTSVWISLGSNLGDRQAILDAAVNRLAQTPGVVVSMVSSYHETQPVGGPAGQGPFLNAAARLETSLSPHELLAATQAIERDLGRVRTVRWDERTLDLDLLIFGCKFVDESDLKLPHPRLAVRRFVLEPLAEIAPQIVDTVTRRPIADLLNNLDRRPRLVMWDAPSLKSVDVIARKVAEALAGLSIHQANLPLVVDLPLDFAAEIEQERRDVLAQLDLIHRTIRRFDQEAFEWVVADFWLDIPGLTKFTDQHPLRLASDHARSFWYEPERRWKTALRMHMRWTSEPTMIIAGPGSDLARRHNRLGRIPVYWPEATEPDAIVAEVVSVCRGVESV